MAQTPVFEPGERIGPYVVEAVLGEGAMGVVYRASPSAGGHTVALKVLRRELSGDPVYERRFVHEARAASSLRHKHLVAVLDAGEDGGQRYLAVAYVGGGSLAERLEAGPLPLDELLRMVADVGAGLDALHAAGLVHRDVKPDNILLDEAGSAALTDFGLAKGPAYTVLTRAGQALGTLDYMAPELVRGAPATAASDLYSLGCVVFECIAGTPPFSGKSLFAVGSAHVSEDPPDPLANRPDLPANLSWAVLQALAKEPEDRPASATMYAHMLRLAAKG
jgi:serine/threonine-protein kinase